jgi:hypothetical protein
VEKVAKASVTVMQSEVNPAAPSVEKAVAGKSRARPVSHK